MTGTLTEMAQTPSDLRVLRISKSGVVAAWRERERQIRSRGVDLTLLSAEAWEEGGSLVRCSPDGDTFVTTVRTIGHHPNGFIYEPLGLWRVLRSQQWDLIDMQEEPFGLASAEVRLFLRLSGRRTPFVIFSAQNIEKRYPIPFRWFEHGALREAAGAYPCNTEAAAIMQRKGLGGPAIVLPLGVDLDRFVVADRPEPTEVLSIGYVGRLIPHKGVDVLIRAVALEPRLSAEIFGGGSERAALEALAAEVSVTDRVTFHGHLEEAKVPATYATFDVLAVPSLPMPTWLEQFGRVVVEAQASGVPVVASASGALPDVVGEAGLLVPPGDPEALRSALVRMLDEPGLWARARQAGLRSAPHYSWSAVADAQVALYREALGRLGSHDGTVGTEDGIGGRRALTKVAFVDHCALESGAEVALARLLPALAETTPVVILGEDGPLAQRLRAEGIEVRILELDRATRKFGRSGVVPGLGALRAALSTGTYALRLARLLKDLDVELVATNSLKSALYGGVAGRLARIPVVWHLRDRIADDYLPSSAVRMVRYAARRLPRGIVANSAATLSTVGLEPSATVQVVGDPCPAEEFALERTTDPVHLTIGIVGRISPWKGQDLFLRAFADAFPEGEVRARIIGGALFGEEALSEELAGLAHDLGIADRVAFLGHVSDVPHQLAALDIAVHASTIPEPFGQVVVEAMAAGTTVVAADAGGPAEIVTDGVDGLLYAMGDAHALAACLARLAADPELRLALADRGRTTAEHYAPGRVAAEVEAVYAAVLAS